MIKKLIIIPFILLLFIIGLSVDRGSSMQFIAGQAPEVTGGVNPDIATQAVVRVSSDSGTSVFKIGLYLKADNSKISESSEGSTSSGTAEAITVNLSTPTELSSSTYYRIALFSGNANLNYYSDDGAGYDTSRDSGPTYDTYPDPLGSADGTKTGETSIQLKNGNGTVILGPADISGYNTSQNTTSGTLYFYTAGYQY